MRIDPAATLQAALLGLLKGAKGSDAAPGFTPAANASPAPPASTVTPGNPPASVAMLVAMAAQAPAAHRAPALRRAERGLDGLGRLHRALATGAPPQEALQDLRNWTADQVEAEGKLADLLRDMELRILVELAKAER